MAIRVHGLLKPTLILSLVEGGSLVANTTYYVVGCMKYAGRVYNALAGPFSELQTITTTLTAKSIEISQKTYRTITAFSDNGDGRTLVECVRHCLDSADIIKIDSGSYTGSWTVDEWVDYDHYIIDTPYVDTAEIESYTDSVIYNYPKNCNMAYTTAAGMVYYIYTTNPYDSNGSWVGLFNRYTDGAYTGTKVSNPVIITALPAQTMSGGNISSLRMDRGMYKALQETGMVFLKIDSVVTLQNIYDAVQESGFGLCCSYNATSGAASKPYFVLHGTMIAIGTGGFSDTGVNFTMIGGEIWGATEASISLYQCLLNIVPSTFSSYYLLTLDQGSLYNNAASNHIVGYTHGDDISVQSSFRFSHVHCDVPYLKYNNLADGLQVNYGIIQNKTFKATNVGNTHQINYDANVIKNCVTYPIYWVNQNNAAGNIPDIYMMENTHVYYTYPWHFRYYAYKPFAYFKFKYLNVTTDEPGNLVKCIHLNAATIDAEFYRRYEITLLNGLTPISGAIVKIIDNTGVEYSGVTNIDGYSYIDVLVQFTSFVQTDPAQSSHDPIYDTLYYAESLSITASGYMDYNEIITGSADIVKVIGATPISIPLAIDSVVITDVSEIGGNDGSLVITASGGDGSYTYSINGTDYQASNTFSGLSAGSVTVYVKDGEGTIETLSDVEVVEPVYSYVLVDAYIKADLEETKIYAKI